MRHPKRRHHHGDPWENAPAWAIELGIGVGILIKNTETIMTIAQDLEDEVAAESTVIASVETVVQNLIDAVKGAGTDQAKLTAVLAAAQANKARLGALAAANTAANPEAVASPAAPEITA